MAKTPEEIKEARRAGMAKTRAIKASLNALLKEKEKNERNLSTDEQAPEPERVSARTIYFDSEYHDYNNFVEGMKLAVGMFPTWGLKSPADLQKVVPFAEEFVRICKEKYPE